MLEPAILTVVAPIRKIWDGCTAPCPHGGDDDDNGKCDRPEDCLARLLREQMDPGWLDRDSRHPNQKETGQRQGEFDFNALNGLHCCSFVIAPSATKKGFIRGTVELDACLIMEATFDGSMEDFLQDLIDTNAAQLHRIFRFCEGFPENALRHPELMADFLRRKHVHHNTYFSGVPGRSISEIKTEALMRTRLSEYLNKTYKAFVNGKPDNRPRAKFRDLQRELRNVVRRDPLISMTEERPAPPWSVRNGSLALFAAGAALAAIFLTLTCCLLWFFGIGFDDFRSLAEAYLTGPGASLTALITLMFVLVAAWGGVRVLKYFAAPETQRRYSRGLYHLADEFLSLALFTLKVAMVIAGTAIALGLVVREEIATTGAVGLMLLIVFAASFAFYHALRIRAAPLRRIEIGPFSSHAAKQKREMDRGIVDTVGLIRRLWCLTLFPPAALVLDQIVFGWWWPGWATCLLTALVCVTAVGIYFLAAMILLLVVKNALMAIAWLLDAIERRWCFAPANTLSERASPRNHIWAREEHRTNLSQNHFASQTLVKNLPRMLYLRITLTLVNFLARYLFNKGVLGGIPTIFSARWVLLDRGHRLIFLTNYVGAWDSYLGEFSDLNAYVGVNAIWTNTYVPLPESEKQRLGTDGRDVGFPKSSLFIFGGAAYEQPFKAYVRKSQLETLTWYGAYPGLSVPNINDNSRIRRDLFRTLSTAELDALFKRI